MRLVGLPAGLAVMVSAANPWVEPRKPSNEVLKEIEAIERLADAEPVSAAIDTRLRLADSLKRFYPEQAGRIARDALLVMPQVRAERIRAGYAARAVELLAISGDLDSAEQALGYIPSDHMSASMAFDQLTAYWLELGRQEAAGFLSRSLDAGRLRPLSLHMVMRYSVEQDPGEARLLFAKAMEVVARQGIAADDIEGLLLLARLVAPVEPSGAVNAVGQLLDMVTSEKFQPRPECSAMFQAGNRRVPVNGLKGMLLFQIGAFLRAWSPELFEQHRQQFEPWVEAMADAGKTTGPQVIERRGFPGPRNQAPPPAVPLAPRSAMPLRKEEVDLRPIDVALQEARAESDPSVRASRIVEILRVSREVRRGEWKAMADEAFHELEQIPLARRFGVSVELFELSLGWAELASARRAGETLLAVISTQARCDEHICEGDADPGLAVGPSYQSMVERLSWHRHSAEDVGMPDASLIARERLAAFDREIHRPQSVH